MLESADCTPTEGMASYPVDGSQKVDRVKYSDETVWINDTHYFEGIPEEVWEHRVGGYQPAAKWLKDRRGRKLSFDEIEHYQKIIGTLAATQDLLIEIEEAYNA
ncbi:MAG: hypothetical protein EOR89_25470 [Mesorhizobium sp.]|nr:MAG: hypothetical protein EOR89_25470 [Mesorhizobium sp.]